MKNCYDCNHCEVCRWIDEFKDKGVCDFYENGTPPDDKCHYCEHNFTPYKGNTGEFEPQEMRDCKHCNYSLETACPFDLTGKCKGEEHHNKRLLEQEPKTGHWIRVDKDKLKCSECEVVHFIAQYPQSAKINYCPNCGADMSR